MNRAQLLSRVDDLSRGLMSMHDLTEQEVDDAYYMVQDIHNRIENKYKKSRNLEK